MVKLPVLTAVLVPVLVIMLGGVSYAQEPATADGAETALAAGWYAKAGVLFSELYEQSGELEHLKQAGLAFLKAGTASGRAEAVAAFRRYLAAAQTPAQRQEAEQLIVRAERAGEGAPAAPPGGAIIPPPPAPGVPPPAPPAAVPPKYPPETPLDSIPTERHSENLMTAGIVMVGAGHVISLAGLLMAIFNPYSFDCHHAQDVDACYADETDARIRDRTIAISGAATALLGIPLAIFGGQQAPVDCPGGRAQLVVGPGSMVLQGSF